MKDVRTIFRLLKLLAQQSLAQLLIYRLSATFIVIFGTLFALAEVVSLLVYFQFTDTIAGWNFYAFLALTATFSLVQYIYQFFFILSHESVMDKILDGELDYDLIRPLDAQVLCTMKQLDYPSLLNMLIPLLLLAYSLPHLLLPWGFASIGIYFLLVIWGVFFYYLLNQFFVALSFWIERPQKLSGVPEYLLEFARRPATVYPRSLQFALTLVLPIVTATNVPVEVLTGHIDIVALFTFLCITIVFAFIVRYQWLIGIRRYASTN